MSTLSSSRLLRLVLALVLLPALLPTVPAAPVRAGTDTDGFGCVNGTKQGVIRVNGTATLACIDDGSREGGWKEPTNPRPSCVNGWGEFIRPRYIDDATQQQAWSNKNNAISPEVIDAYFYQSRERVINAIKSVDGNSNAFYWDSAFPELVAVELQIEPVGTGGGDSWLERSRSRVWIHHQLSFKERSAYFSDRSREATKINSTTLVAEAAPYMGRELSLANPQGTLVFLHSESSVKAWPLLADYPGTSGLREMVVDAFRNSGVGGGSPSFSDIIRDGIAQTGDFPDFGNANEPGNTNELAAWYRNYAWLTDENGRKAPAIVYASKQLEDPNLPGTFFKSELIGNVWVSTSEPTGWGPANRIESAAEFQNLTSGPWTEENVRVEVALLTPNRTRSFNYDLSTLRAALDSIIARQMQVQRGQITRDIHDFNNGKYYIYPAFFAPSADGGGDVCGEANYAISGPTEDPLLVSPLKKFAFDTSYAGCKTKAVGSIAAWRSNIPTGASGLRGDACWINWRAMPIPEPKFEWNSSIYEDMHAVNYTSTAIGSVGNPVVLQARRQSGAVVYRDPDNNLLMPLPRNTDKELDVSGSIGFTLYPSIYNLTQAGLSAEVGIPGGGGMILARQGRKSVAGTEYNLPITFNQTALERLQTTPCNQFTKRSDLLLYCGIGYDADGPNNDGKGEWFYRVHMRTWYNGIYYAPMGNFEWPEVRSLFNSGQSSITGFDQGISGTRAPSAPTQIRDYRWPGAPAGNYQWWAMAFDGVNQPVISSQTGDWKVMADMMAAPELGGYSYLSGKRYLLLDASAPDDNCVDPLDKTACYVDVYVRSRQPVLDR